MDLVKKEVIGNKGKSWEVFVVFVYQIFGFFVGGELGDLYTDKWGKGPGSYNANTEIVAVLLFSLIILFPIGYWGSKKIFSKYFRGTLVIINCLYLILLSLMVLGRVIY